MDRPNYADPIVIPFQLTIPDPRPRPGGGPFDDGPSFHPSFTSPGWFSRNYPAAVVERAQFAVPDLPWFGPPVVSPDQSGLPGAASLDAQIARARRRAEEIERELSQGELGAAAGHLLLGPMGGFPYPGSVEDPPVTILNNEAGDEADQPSGGRKTLGELTDQAQADLEARLADALDDRHLQAAESDRKEDPIKRPDGSDYDHENEVAQSARGLKNTLERLENKLQHDIRRRGLKPSAPSAQKAIALIEKIREVLAAIERRLPNLEVRQGDRRGGM